MDDRASEDQQRFPSVGRFAELFVTGSDEPDLSKRRNLYHRPVERSTDLQLSRTHTEMTSKNQQEGQIGRRLRGQKWFWAILAAAFLVVAGIFMLKALALTFRRAPSIGCLANLQSIQIAAKAWADEHHTNRLPADFALFASRLSAPGVLKCPADGSRPGIANWSEPPSTNISYIINSEGAFTDSTNEYVVCVHHHYAVMGNGKLSHTYNAGMIIPTRP